MSWFSRYCFLCRLPINRPRPRKGDYCSNKCRQKAYRIRKANDLPQGTLPRSEELPAGKNKIPLRLDRSVTESPPLPASAEVSPPSCSTLQQSVTKPPSKRTRKGGAS